MEKYFGTYKRFETVDKKEAAALMGSDCIVGDVFTIEFTTEEGNQRAWLTNRFGKKVGYFSFDFSRELSVMVARDWKLSASLSFVAFTDRPAPGAYWGEAAIVAYDPTIEEEVTTFFHDARLRMADGNRPDIALSPKAIQEVIDKKGKWQPAKLVDFPVMNHGTVMVKSRRTASDKLIDEGRKGKVGCYIVSWIFNIVLVGGVIALVLHLCGVF